MTFVRRAQGNLDGAMNDSLHTRGLLCEGVRLQTGRTTSPQMNKAGGWMAAA